MPGEIPKIPENKENLRYAVLQRASEKHPERNEDAVLSDRENLAFAVFDGMGGHSAGDVASRMAKEIVAREIASLAEDLDSDEYMTALEKIFIKANEEILKDEELNDDHAGMGTTASLVKLFDGEAIFSHVGDSKIYKWSEASGLEQVSTDDDYLNQSDIYLMKSAVKLTPTDDDRRQIRAILSNASSEEDFSNRQIAGLNAEQSRAVLAELFSKRNIISQNLGINRLNSHVGKVGFSKGEYFIICSDGISDNLTAGEINELISEGGSEHAISQRLIDAAVERSHDKNHMRHKFDDMTVAVIKPS